MQPTLEEETRVRLMLLLSTVALLACDSTGPGETVTFIFNHREAPGADGQFYAVTDDPEVIRGARAQLAIPADQRRLAINGPIGRGDGGHNEPWSWHFAPGEWELLTVGAEACDGTPQMVEDNIDYWVDNLGHFCPWAAYLVGER